MDNTRISYSVTSFAAASVAKKIQDANDHFSNFMPQLSLINESVLADNVAHITLKSLFYLNNPFDEEIIQEKLRQISFPPIPIIAHDVAIFESIKFGNVLVVKVEKTKALQQLHLDILHVIDPFETHEMPAHEGSAYNPHISILYSVPESHIEEAEVYAKEHVLPIQYTLQSFQFMKAVKGGGKERVMIENYPANKTKRDQWEPGIIG